MILRMLRYAYADTRSRALAASFSTVDAWLRIAGKAQRQDAVAALSDLLAVPPPAEGLDEEHLLGCDFLRLGRRIVKTLFGADRQLLITLLGRIDLQNLLVVCRGLHRREGDDGWRRMLVDPAPFGEFPVGPLASVDDFSTLIEALSAHPYRTVVEESLGIDGERRLFWLESSLERTFWEQVFRAARALAPFDRHAAEEILGLRADLDRFNLIHRGWRSGASTEDILRGLPPLGTLFPPKAVRQALVGENPEEKLSRLFPGEDVDPLGVAGEVALARRLFRQLRRILRSHPFDISVPLAVLLLKELEIRDLRIAVNGARFRRPVEELPDLFAMAEAG